MSTGPRRSPPSPLPVQGATIRGIHPPHLPPGRGFIMPDDLTASRQAAEEREQLVAKLQAALAEVKSLREILPICSYCRKIRDDADYWHTLESYVGRHTNSRFSHGICPGCMESEVEPQCIDTRRGTAAGASSACGGGTTVISLSTLDD